MLSELPQFGNHLPPEAVLPASGLIETFIKYRVGLVAENLWPLARCIWNLRRQKFDALAYLVPSTRTPRQRRRDALFFKLAGIRRILGFEGFPDDALPRTPQGVLMPVVAEADALLVRLGVDGIAVPQKGCGSMELLLQAGERQAVEQWWRAQGGVRQLAPRGWFALCPGSKWDSKRWPAERFIELGARLWAEHGLLPVVLGGPEDRDLALRMIAQWKVGLCAAGDLSVRESAALLEGAAFYVGNDTGTMHLAAAVGTRCVGIFSAQDWPGRWHPYGSGHKVLRAEVPCAGCQSPRCEQDLQCLTLLHTEEVYEACLELLKAEPPAPRES